jgi:signal transduction histidine kinase/ActR/RegA family two-component response regulator
MNHWLRNAPIRHKLMILGLAASLCALLTASVVFLVTTYVTARRTTHDTVIAQSAIAAENIATALAFSDSAAANETLRALHALPSIDLACAWDGEGRLFAAYQARESIPCPARAMAAMDRVERSRVEIVRAVTLGQRQVGTLYVRGNLNDATTLLMIQAMATLAALLLGSGAAVAFASRFQRIIASPLAGLASTASDVSRRGDYGVRARLAGTDEVGQVIVTFNEMLDEIERRDNELRKANRLKDEFLATLSHELRTPLNAILGWLQILRTAPPSEERLEQALTRLERNARAQAQLVEDLLDVSRIAAGKLQLKMAPVDIAQIVEAAVDVVRPAADAKGIHVQTEFDHPPFVVKGDPDRLQQAIWNLLTNAVKFSHPEGRVTISARHVGMETTVTVEDDGAGIEPDLVPHIFERFRQGDQSLTRQYAGLGLGLAIVREVVSAHGGRIEAFSAGVGRGSRFVMHLNSADRQPPQASEEEASSPGDSVLSGLSTLVVDDDADEREIAAVALASHGAYVATARSAAEALELIASRAMDVIVADLSMPHVDGYGLLSQLRATESVTEGSNRSIPVVAVTAQASRHEESRATTAGFAAYVRKPYRFDELVSAVAAAVRTARAV